MQTQSFLRGIFYTLGMLEIHPSKTEEFGLVLSSLGMQFPIFTKVGKMTIVINRGISHSFGNLAVAADPNFPSEFDTVENWCNPEVWDTIWRMGYDIGCGEIRIGFIDLCRIIEWCGGIDYPAMHKFICDCTSGKVRPYGVDGELA